MTMLFKAQEPNQKAGIRDGDRISFLLQVTDMESWIDQITRVGVTQPAKQVQSVELPRAQGESSRPRRPLLTFKFANELGQGVALDDFRGEALAITFFFTRCPIPDYCPRRSKNSQKAAKILSASPGCPTNWHFLSVSFDTEFDNPSVLKAYEELYDPTHWSFLTGPAEQIGQLARLSDARFAREGGATSRNFRTLIMDPTGHLQMVFPTGGDLAEAIVEEILKSATVANKSISDNPVRALEHEANQKLRAPSFHAE
jgi:protein SCO1/2